MVGDPRMLDDDFGGNHPLDPLRWELTWLLAKSPGVIDSFEVFAPSPAGVETLGLIHAPGYIDADRRASRTGVRIAVGHGLGTPDTPIFPGIHESAALIAGGSSWWSVPVPPGTPSNARRPAAPDQSGAAGLVQLFSARGVRSDLQLSGPLRLLAGVRVAGQAARRVEQAHPGPSVPPRLGDPRR